METQKLRILSEVNKKLVDFQNAMKIHLEYDDGSTSSFDLLKEENVWVQDEEFGVGSRYKTLKQYNKTEEHDLAPTIFEGKEGSVVPTHTHRESHLFICLDGKVRVTLDDGKEFILKPTESIYINSYQPHKFEFLIDSRIVILVLNI